MARQIPLVDYLVLGDDPHLRAHECVGCGARYFDRRNACAACSGTQFHAATVERAGVLRTFTIVTALAPGVPAPFVAGVIDCAGTSVRASLVNVSPDPDHVRIGMKVRLTTYVAGTDDEGTQAVGFGFEPIEPMEVRSNA